MEDGVEIIDRSSDVAIMTHWPALSFVFEQQLNERE